MSMFPKPGCFWCGVDVVGVFQLYKPLLGAAHPWVSEEEEVAILVRSEVPGLEKRNKYNGPIVLLGSGSETGHPDRCETLFVHFDNLKTVKLVFCHPFQLSCRFFLQESFSF